MMVRSLLGAGLVVLVAGKSNFNCPALLNIPEPTDISQLHPSHVTLAIAVGDSMTAAFSARSTLLEARDISWSIGKGYADQLTLPYMLKQYSGEVQGVSTEAVLPADFTHLPKGDYHPRTDHLNVAESMGAAHLGSFEEQWGYLQSGFKEYPNFDSQWKVLTIFMFANDVCGQCSTPVEDDGRMKIWEDRLQEFLVNATGTLKKTYINLVTMLDLSNIHRIQQSTPYCSFIHDHILHECGCIDRGDPQELAMLDRNVHTMNARLHKFAVDWAATLKTQGRSDLAIVVQPFMEGVGAVLDRTFLSKLDCFHPDKKAHQLMAIGLWNSMLCTGDRKNMCGQPFSLDMQPVCPTESSVFYTGPDVVPNPPPSALSVVV